MIHLMMFLSFMEKKMKTQHFKQIGLLLLIGTLLFTSINVTPAHALDVPTQTDPADGSTSTAADTPPLGIPEFKWGAVAGATKYRLQISPDTAFTTFTVNTTTTNTSYTPTSASAFSDGDYYWRVRVESPTVGDYSGIWMFTKEWASIGNAPTLLSPDNGSTLDFYDYQTFSWGPVTGASKYELQIYASSGGWGTLEFTEVTLATTHQPNVKLTNGVHYWRVVPIDPGNRDGTPSEERSFTAGYNLIPTLLEPADYATPTFTPTFRWTAVRGAEFYTLQYSTNSDFSAPVTTVNTKNTSWTPQSTIPNDVNYYWRVKVTSGNSISDWTPTRRFIKKWYIKPVLLTPTNLYQHQRFPIFSWTPVPGASYYKVEISGNSGFSPMYDSGTTSNTFYSPSKYDGDDLIYYWRVTPYDGNGEAGKTSDMSSYRSYQESVAPHQVYPLYYYPPDTYTGFPGITTNPHEDRTVPYPIFIWHRVLQPIGVVNQGEVYAEAYRVQVSTDPTFASVSWWVDTENTTASPTTGNPFTPSTNTDYYWRVCALVGGACPINVGNEVWSQVWRTRFNPSLGLTPRGTAPQLIRPTSGFEFAESTPLLEWFPMSGATAYDVQISPDSAFASFVDSATVSTPAYVPTQALAMRRLGDVNFGVYYWRVRKSPSGTWSETRRFQIAAQSQWKFARSLGDAANRLQIGLDPASDIADSDYDITSLQVAQSSSDWYFGFHVPAAPTKNVTYALYLDLDHQDASGATSDARGYTVTTISPYRPEYAIYVLQETGAFNASKVYLYHWNGTGWDTVNVLQTIGGGINFNVDYVELRIPNTAIGYQDTTGSYAISLFSLPVGSGLPRDSVPSDPNVPGSGAISRFANVTERLNLVMPPTDAGLNLSTYPSILPFFWDMPILTPFSGAYMKAYLDPLFTTEAATYTLTSDSAYYTQTSHAWADDFIGDNTYYWRVQPRYRETGCGTSLCSGAWSQGWRFERKGFVPQNLTISVTFATPTFSWDMVEGAEYYELWVDDDPVFGSPVKITTRQNSYTDDGTFAKGTYNWKVRVRRHGGEYNSWSAIQSFTLTLPTPGGLDHLPAGVVGRAPTLTWTPVIRPTSGDAVFAAWKYRVQVSTEPTFSATYDSVDTEQRSWTPKEGYDDGTYYWHVAVYDGAGKMGAYSAYQTFTKQYPITTLVSPISGAHQDTTPTFVWTPVNGAATYKLQVSKVATFATNYDSITTPNTSFTPTKTYDNGVTYYWRVAIVDANSNIGPYTDATIILDPLGPDVVSSNRVQATPTDRASVQFTVTFSENVTGVDTADFSLTKTGAIVNASVTTVSGSGKTYTVTVGTGTGNGTLRLDVLNNGTIKNAALVPLNSAFTSGEVYTVNKVFLARSVATQDGWIVETGESTNKGGTISSTATTLRLGDDAAKEQYRTILSFNTSGLLDTTVLTKVTLKFRLQGVVGGGNPVTIFNGFMADIRRGTFGTSALQAGDWQTTASKTSGPFTPAFVSGWYSINLTSVRAYVNKLSTSNGLTQIRLRFKLDDNNNGIANYLSLYSGNAGAASSPQLIIEYYVP
jgi:hypothetical protein